MDCSTNVGGKELCARQNAVNAYICSYRVLVSLFAQSLQGIDQTSCVGNKKSGTSKLHWYRTAVALWLSFTFFEDVIFWENPTYIVNYLEIRSNLWQSNYHLQVDGMVISYNHLRYIRSMHSPYQKENNVLITHPMKQNLSIWCLTVWNNQYHWHLHVN